MPKLEQWEDYSTGDVHLKLYVDGEVVDHEVVTKEQQMVLGHERFLRTLRLFRKQAIHGDRA